MNQVVTKERIKDQVQAKGPASQATQIEQSRAVAQVQGALIVAQRSPRDEMVAMDRIREACQSPKLADRAFFSFPRGSTTVSGPSIHLATELARCWGNVDFGIVELSRNDLKGESEMLAVAWDLETNTRVSNSFIVPHKRDKRGKAPEALTDMRDIYENNANQGARRLRECIFRVVPVYVREEAQNMCRDVLEHGGGVPLAERREKLLAAFAELGINRKQIEKRAGQHADRLTVVDIANLGVMYQSLKRGEISAADAFPPEHSEEVSESLKGKRADKAPGKTEEGGPAEPPAPKGEPSGPSDPPAPESVDQTEPGEDEDAFIVDRLTRAIAEATTPQQVDQIMTRNINAYAELTKPSRALVDNRKREKMKELGVK